MILEQQKVFDRVVREVSETEKIPSAQRWWTWTEEP